MRFISAHRTIVVAISLCLSSQASAQSARPTGDWQHSQGPSPLDGRWFCKIGRHFDNGTDFDIFFDGSVLRLKFKDPRWHLQNGARYEASIRNDDRPEARVTVNAISTEEIGIGSSNPDPVIKTIGEAGVFHIEAAGDVLNFEMAGTFAALEDLKRCGAQMRSDPTALKQSQTASTEMGTPSLEDAKAKCTELGFKKGTEKFGSCVLKLSR